MNSNSRKEKEEDSAKFSLTSANSLFSSKSNDIFAGLDALEQKHTAYQKNQESFESLERAGVMKHDPVEDHEDGEKRDRRHANASSNSRDKDSHPYRQRNNRDRPSPRSWNSDLHNRNTNFPRDDFRRPRHQAPKSKRAPDFKVNPDRWTSYSLDDVPEKDLSEKSNTRAALDFLWERKSDREKQERLAAGLPAEEEKFESETAACSKGLISFSRKKQKDKKMDCDNESKSAVNRDLLGDAFSEQDNDVGSSTTDNSSSRSRKSQMSESEADVSNLLRSNPDNCDDEGQQTTVQAPTFKSRKNVRKQFRRRNDDDEEAGDDK